MKLRKAGKAGSTLLKLASHADDVNDASKVVYAFATDKDPKAAIGNLVMGQAQGFAAKKAGGLLNGKFGKTNATDVPDIPTNSTKQHIEVDSSGLNSKKLKIDPTVVHQKKNPKLDLKIEPTVKADLASTPKPHVDVETSKIKPVEAVAGAATVVPKSKKPDIDVLTKSKDLSTIKGESVDQVGTVKPKVDLDVPEVKDVHDVEAPKYNKEQILQKDLRPYTGDLMDPIEAKRYSGYWRSKGMGSEETWQDFKKNIPNGTIDDYNKILYEQDPWPLNVKPSFKILKGGDTFEMAMAPRSKQLDTWPGNFATDINTISDRQYVRDRLAVKYNWKPDIDRVVQYRVKEGSEIPANVGPIGPQIDLEINRYLPGGPNQIEMLMGREKMNYLEIIGIRNIE